MEWEVVIGLETHTQLKTNTKIFSGASTQYGAAPNTQACEVSIALPGVLPVLNRQAVECAIKFGLAINAEIAPRSVFARKNYFYPDLPKGYQISQFELPVVGKGAITIQVPANGKNAAYEKVVNITRAHLEEDAGKSVHGLDKYCEDDYAEPGYFEERKWLADFSGIDLNRAGTPLLEIVTEPDMRSAAEAIAYAKKLHELVQWIDICDGNMQEGSFRCDVNVSVRPKGSDKLGTRREIKNLNSFEFMQQAIEYETRWQIETLEDGGKIQQATVLFNPDTGETKSMRSKEEANDYRYFPDPDLLPLEVTEADKARVQATMPELPEVMKARLEGEYGLSSYDALAMTASHQTAAYFFDFVSSGISPKVVVNWIMSYVLAKLNLEKVSISDSLISPAELLEVYKNFEDDTINRNGVKVLVDELWAVNALPKIVELTGTAVSSSTVVGSLSVKVSNIIKAKGLKQESDSGAIEAIIDEILKANPAMVEEFKAGKEKAFNALVGQAMKASKGKANPAQVNQILKNKL